jgi:hypothetical protein
MYRECKSRLENIRNSHPEIFASRNLYLSVHKMLESYTFKLAARREVLMLFFAEAKLKKKHFKLATEEQSVSNL